MSFKNSFFADFDAKERKVLVILISLILIIIILLNINSVWHRDVEVEGWKKEKLDEIALEIETKKKKNRSLYLQENKSNSKDNLESEEDVDYNNSSDKIQYFDFNPDTLALEDWVKLGFSEKQAQALINYSKAIDCFNKESFLASFVIDSSKYKELEPYIQFSDSSTIAKNSYNSFEEVESGPIVINMQTADTTEWKKISGIGVVLSKRIVKYRKELGGFSNINQLLEVYGVSNELLDKCIDQLELNKNEIKKVNINKADYNKLKAHPYIDYNLSKSIVNYRKYRGNFVTIDDLFNIPNISEENVLKLEPYLNFKND